MMMKKYLQIFSLILVSLTISLGAAELVVRWAVLFENERAVASQSRQDEPSDRTEAISKSIVHPFLGWTMQPGTREQQNTTILNRFFSSGLPKERWWENHVVNDLGFFSKHPDYRDIHRDRFVIGIFGGSVADLFANTISETMTGRLSKLLAIPENKILVLSFAAGGYKQPQQVNALTYALLLGIHFDVIVNIDGFNEMALGGSDCQQGYHPIYPSRSHLKSVAALSSGRLSVSSMKLSIEIAREKKRIRRLGAMVNKYAWFGKSELAKAIIGTVMARRAANAAQLENELQILLASDSTAGIIPDLPDPHLRSADGCRKLTSEIWARGSELLAGMARNAGAKYIHILQPNQYIPGGKVLSKDELDYAYSPDHVWSKNVVGAYPFFTKKGNHLMNKGIVFHDFSNVFKSHEGNIYIDQCCHFNMKGNEILFSSFGSVLATVVRK